MSINANTVWEVRPATGNSSNGGGYFGGGTDRSQQDAAHVVIDGTTISAAVMATTTRLQLTGYTVDASDVGNTVQNVTGTGTKGFFQITGINAGSNYWQLDRGAGTAAQTFIGNMGGALNGLNPAGAVTKIQAVAIAGNVIWIKKQTWGEDIALSNNSVSLVGYQTTRGDAPQGNNRPRNNSVGTTPLSFSGRTTCIAKHLILSGGSGRAFNGNSTTACKLINVRMCNAGGCGHQGDTGDTTFVDCEFDGNALSGTQDTSGTCIFLNCVSHHNGTSDTSHHGFYSQNGTAIGCLAWCNASHGFATGASASLAIWRACAAILNNIGMTITSVTPAGQIKGCSATQSTTYGWNNYILFETADGDYNNNYGNGTAMEFGSAGAHDQTLNPGYADLSKVDLTDLAIDAANATKVASAAHPFVAGDVGKYLRVTAGTGFTVGGYYILAVDGSNVATLDAACGATSSTGGTAAKWTQDFTGAATLAGLGWPQAIPGTPTVNYPPIGAIQSETGVTSGGLDLPDPLTVGA